MLVKENSTKTLWKSKFLGKFMGGGVYHLVIEKAYTMDESIETGEVTQKILQRASIGVRRELWS
tara:strand:+ start:2987 stop:3178 length:192 start_codon:yes stop_codon:yes gene_type:complete